MEENSSFLSVKKNIKEKDVKKRHTKIKLNQKLNSNIQNIIIVILILIIIILCLVIGILLLTRDSSKINNNNNNYNNYNDTNFEKEIISNKTELKTNSDKKLENKEKENKDKKEEKEVKKEEEEEKEEEKEEKDEIKIISKKKSPTRKRLFQVKSDPIPKGKNQIHIAMAIDNHFVYPTLVSMASGLYNNNDKENVIVYHLLFSHNFNKDNFEVFDSLKKDINSL